MGGELRVLDCPCIPRVTRYICASRPFFLNFGDSFAEFSDFFYNVVSGWPLVILEADEIMSIRVHFWTRLNKRKSVSFVFIALYKPTGRNRYQGGQKRAFGWSNSHCCASYGIAITGAMNTITEVIFRRRRQREVWVDCIIGPARVHHVEGEKSLRFFWPQTSHCIPTQSYIKRGALRA